MRPEPPPSASPLADLPQWARVAFLFGFPAAVASYLIFVMAGSVNANTDAAAKATAQTGAILLQHVQRMEQMSDARSGELTELRVLMRSQERYYRLICVRLSKTEVERQQCLSVP